MRGRVRDAIGAGWWSALGAVGLSRERWNGLPSLVRRTVKAILWLAVGLALIGFIQAFNEGLRGDFHIGTFNVHSPGSDWTESIVFSILILILVFRPEGLLGERTPEGG